MLSGMRTDPPTLVSLLTPWLLGAALGALAGCASDPQPKPAAAEAAEPSAPAPPPARRRAAAPAPRPERSEPAPIAVLIQTDPGLTVAGSDTPRVAVYADGLVIGVRAEGEEPVYVSGQLGPEALAQLEEDLGALSDAASWKPRYDMAPGVPAQPETRLYLRLGEQTHVTTIYGFPRAGAQRPSLVKQPDSPPVGLLQVHRYLCELGLEEADPWTPNQLEVMVWREEGIDYGQAPKWPLGWAAFDSSRTIRWREGAYSIFLAGSRLRDLRAFLERGGGKAQIEGRGWWVDFRFVFPSYRVYEAAFSR